jgi:hypothetical protein
MYTSTRKAIGAFLRPLSALLLALLVKVATHSPCAAVLGRAPIIGLFLPARLRSLKCSRAFFSG